MKFLVISSRNSIYTYEADKAGMPRLCIEGSDKFSIAEDSMEEDVKSYLDALAEEKNLESVDELELDIFEGSEKKIIELIRKELKGTGVHVYDLKPILTSVIKKLSANEELMIPKYGINYNGVCYQLEGEEIKEDKFSLLAYTIHVEDIIRWIE